MNNSTVESKALRPRPVLMTPIRRCGSHALRLRLNLSPDFYSPYPLHIVDFMPLVRLYEDLNDDWSYFQLIVDLVGLQNATMIKWDGVALDPVKIFESIKYKSRSPHRVAWEMLFQAGAKHQAKVVMDKSLDNVHYAPELIDLFDDLLFLNVVRDPRDYQLRKFRADYLEMVKKRLLEQQVEVLNRFENTSKSMGIK